MKIIAKTMDSSKSMRVASAKKDLMALGIELDDNLIERLQNNLGIEKIFRVAQRSAVLLKESKKVTSSAVPEISYRNVAVNDQNRQNLTSPFKSSLIHIDEKFTQSLLNDIQSRESNIEPQFRPAIHRIIESFRVQFSRSPERFVCRLLGKKLKTSERGNEAISRLVLKSRYVTETDFRQMIANVDKSITTDLVQALFLLIYEDKQFSSKTRAVVDVWRFLSLLKTASDESRRSYDQRTSKIATDVEFWKKSNAKFQLATDEMKNSAKNEQLLIETYKKLNSGARGEKTPNTRISVAQLLGQQDHNKNNKSPRRAKGNLTDEFTNKCDVAAALHAPPRPHVRSPNKRPISVGEGPPAPPPKATGQVHSSHRVAALLGADNNNTNNVAGYSSTANVGASVWRREWSENMESLIQGNSGQAVRSKSAPRPQTRNTMYREWFNQTTVSQGLRGDPEAEDRLQQHTEYRGAFKNSPRMQEERKGVIAGRRAKPWHGIWAHENKSISLGDAVKGGPNVESPPDTKKEIVRVKLEPGVHSLREIVDLT